MKHLGDITKISGFQVEPVEVIIGGSPCQDLSVAGRRAGLAGERSGLYMEQIRIIKEMRKADEQRGAINIRPRYMVWENVPGAFSSNEGEDFRAVLEEAARIADSSAVIPRPPDGWSNAGAVMGEGWSVAWRVFDAQFWGVPQRRRRIALVADFGGYTAPEILFERNSLSGNPEKSKETREGAAAAVEERAGSADIFTLDRAAFSQGENAKYDFAVDNDGICPTLVARGGAAVFDSRGNGSGEIVPTLTGDHQSRVTDYTALCIGNGQAGQLKMSDKSRSFSCMHDQQAILSRENGVRRLTPLECERLQGYPDGWTDIGEYIDTQGKKRTASDAARYKALGNSIALPPWAWLLDRLYGYCEEKTMASLFDGIGGFPLIWERLGGKCLWASEIEEFPIAVTKYHFGG